MRREREDTPTSPRPSPPLIHIPQAPGARSARLALAPRGAWGRRGRTGRCCLRSPSALRGEGDRGRWVRRLRYSLPRPRPHMLRARPYGRARLCPAESHLSHLSHLIPANPALRKLLVSRARHAPSPAHVRSGRASARRLRDVNRCRAFVARVPTRRYSRPADAALAGRATARTTERSVPVGERSRRRGGAGALAPVGNPPHALKNEEEARSPRGSRRTTCGIE